MGFEEESRLCESRKPPTDRRPIKGSRRWRRRRRTCAFSDKCARLVKEQRARFYIVRRCVTMLLCWHDDPADP
ncbi:hypothetical protein MLD38_038147 [Melastoma candidum]|uniref:Uncharacterized protein n=1 Tax=Melastoma candidum TaxID=119954 RepID=A0ACB9L0A7_9MYRT|nr:hypothetical protein MLD38_038147 [Melastoma candidum]